MVRLMLLMAPTLIWTAGCRADDDASDAPEGGDAERPAEMERLIRASCERAKGVRLAQPDEIRHFDRDNLHRYINGAAERYLGYSFDHAAVGQTQTGEDTFVIELYHFAGSPDAYGLWSTDSVGESVDVGQRSAYGGGLLQLWRGEYFARVFHRKYAQPARETVLAIGRALADAIGEDGDLPDLMRELPAEGVKGTPVFFHEQAMLNYLYYLSDENLLRLGPETDALFAEYEQEEEKAKLLVVRYAEGEAEKARRAFVEEYLEEQPSPAAVVAKLENELFTGMGAQDRTVHIVFDAATEELALRLLKPTAAP